MLQDHLSARVDKLPWIAERAKRSYSTCRPGKGLVRTRRMEQDCRRPLRRVDVEGEPSTRATSRRWVRFHGGSKIGLPRRRCRRRRRPRPAVGGLEQEAGRRERHAVARADFDLDDSRAASGRAGPKVSDASDRHSSEWSVDGAAGVPGVEAGRHPARRGSPRRGGRGGTSRRHGGRRRAGPQDVDTHSSSVLPGASRALMVAAPPARRERLVPGSPPGVLR